MKKEYIAALILLIVCGQIRAQLSNDIVTTGTGYADQVWYSMLNGEVESQPKDNWDLGFSASPFGTSIIINSSAGAILWRYPGSNADFATLDTTGMHAWKQLYNSDTSWAYGAFSRYQSGLDIGWGIYNTITHHVNGDSLYVMRLTSGEYRKLNIIQLASGTYTFRQASLDNTIDVTHTLAKSAYLGKNFGYFDLQNEVEIDREPLSAEWDLLFGQYIAFLPAPYNVSGVLHNAGTQVAQAHPVANPDDYMDYGSHSFHPEINTIGYDWKQFAGAWAIADSLVYFVKTQQQEIWKLVFTGFGGMANGQFEFTKELLLSSSISEPEARFEMQLFPNPAKSHFNLVIDQPAGDVQLLITSVTGKIVHAENLRGYGLTTHAVNSSAFSPGIYLVTLQSNGYRQTKKLIIQ